MNHPMGSGRFRGQRRQPPKGTVNPFAWSAPGASLLPTDGLRSKSWDEFASRRAEHWTSCSRSATSCRGRVPVMAGPPNDRALGRTPTRPQSVGSDDAKRRAFSDALLVMRRRIELFASLPLEKLSRLALQERLHQNRARMRMSGGPLQPSEPIHGAGHALAIGPIVRHESGQRLSSTSRCTWTRATQRHSSFSTRSKRRLRRTMRTGSAESWNAVRAEGADQRTGRGLRLARESTRAAADAGRPARSRCGHQRQEPMVGGRIRAAGLGRVRNWRRTPSSAARRWTCTRPRAWACSSDCVGCSRRTRRWSTRAAATARHRCTSPAQNEVVAAPARRHGADIDARDVDHESTPAQYMMRDRGRTSPAISSRERLPDRLLLMAAALGDLIPRRQHLDAEPRLASVCA